jgi:hypothetical protein
MRNHQTPLERAFDLARSGKYRTYSEVRLQLAREHIPTEQFIGTSLRRQIRDIIAVARPVVFKGS